MGNLPREGFQVFYKSAGAMGVNQPEQLIPINAAKTQNSLRPAPRDPLDGPQFKSCTDSKLKLPN